MNTLSTFPAPEQSELNSISDNPGLGPKASSKPLFKLTGLGERKKAGYQTARGPQETGSTMRIAGFQTKGNSVQKLKLPPMTSRTGEEFMQSTVSHGDMFRTGRSKHTISGAEQFTSQFHRTRESEFFEVMDQIPEQLKKFRQSQMAREESIKDLSGKVVDSEIKRVQQILGKTNYTGKSTRVNLMREEQLYSKVAGKDSDTKLKLVENLQREIHSENMKEIRNLEKKCQALVDELNVVLTNVQEKDRVRHSLFESCSRLEKRNNEILNSNDGEMQTLTQDIKRLNEEQAREKASEQRMNRIIDICNSNKSQNEEWIKELTRYNGSLTKVLEQEKKKLADIKKTNIEADQKVYRLREELGLIRQVQSDQLKNVSVWENKDMEIYKMLQRTNQIISSDMERQRSELADRAQTRLRIIEEEEAEEKMQQKNSHIREELKAVREKMSKYEDIFQPGPNGESWEEKPEIKQLKENLATMRELEKEFMQRQFDYQETKRKNEVMELRIQLLLKAKSQDETEQKPNSYYEQRQTEMEHKIAALDEQIKAKEEQYRDMPKVRSEDHALIKGIADRLPETELEGNIHKVLEVSDNVTILTKSLTKYKRMLETYLTGEEQQALLRGEDSVFLTYMKRQQKSKPTFTIKRGGSNDSVKAGDRANWSPVAGTEGSAGYSPAGYHSPTH